MPSDDPELRVGGADLLAAELEGCLAVYRAAFLELHEDDPEQATIQRRAHMGRHLQRVDVTTAVGMVGDRVIGFCYSAAGHAGTWWHDVVADALAAQQREDWLTSSREVVELHVLPGWQGRGLGRRLLRACLAGAGERTVVLSALDDPASRAGAARRLYAREGFQVLRADFSFPGSPLSYAILARPLPM